METDVATSIPPTWHEVFEVGSYWADISGHLYPHAMLQMMQESAWKHAEALRFGYTDLSEKSLLWVLSRLTADITRLPAWGESVRLETWPTGTHRLFAMREYCLYDENEREVLRANSAWLVLDTEQRRPRKPGPIIESQDIPLNPGNYDEPPAKLDATSADSAHLENTLDTRAHRVRYSDIDVQRHANSAKYLEWTVDSLPDDWLIHFRPRTLSINFLRECEIGDTLSVSGYCGRSDRDARTFQTVHNDRDGKVSCAVLADWQLRES